LHYRFKKAKDSKNEEKKYSSETLFGPQTLEDLQEEETRRRLKNQKECREKHPNYTPDRIDCERSFEEKIDVWYKRNKERILLKIKKQDEQRISEELSRKRTESVLPKLRNEEEISPRSGGKTSDLANSITAIWNKSPKAMELVNILRETKAMAKVKPSEISDAMAKIAKECINSPTDSSYENLISEHLSFDTDVSNWEIKNDGKHPLAAKSFALAVENIDLYMQKFTKDRINNYKPASISALRDMIKLANILDQKGYLKEADYLDGVITYNF
jgi:hypothetical protein